MAAAMLDPAIGTLLVLCLATLFASAAVHKLRDPGRFAAVFDSYQLLPLPVRSVAAMLVPLAESAVAAGVLLGPVRIAAAVVGSVLLITYALAIAINLLRGRRDLACGCGGPADRRVIAAWMVWRNLALAGALMVLAPRWRERALVPADFITISGGLATAVLLYTSVGRLLGEVAPWAAALRAPAARAPR